MIFDIETLLEVPAELFDPVPKVDSVVLRFTHRASPPALKNPEMFYRLIQLGFASRRKTLRNNLKSHFSAEQLQALEEQSGISLSRRAESLNEAEFITLADLL
jgi:16S rRNA (adenine1518-N6/adenine1519-N6)-dimethyltransferase